VINHGVFRCCVRLFYSLNGTLGNRPLPDGICHPSRSRCLPQICELVQQNALYAALMLLLLILWNATLFEAFNQINLLGPTRKELTNLETVVFGLIYITTMPLETGAGSGICRSFLSARRLLAGNFGEVMSGFNLRIPC